MTSCTADGCDRGAVARGLCDRHYRQAKRADALPARLLERLTPDEVLRRFDRTQAGCWHWTGGSRRDGYGTAQGVVAHRVVYELLVGPIPDGMTLDHECHNRDATCPGGFTCRHRACVRPDHLVPRSRRDNTLASALTLASIRAAATHCVHGHEFTEENTYREPKRPHIRTCRECKRRINREIKAKRRKAQEKEPA